MLRELAEAREELTRLDVGGAPITASAETSADDDELLRPISTTLVSDDSQ
jgi:hypothetical protein